MGVPTAELPPRGLSAHWLGVWRHALKTLKEQGTWKWEQAPLLSEYIYALREADTGREQAESDPWHETEKGLLHPHPGFQLADRAVRRANALAKTLKLTPEEQSRLAKARLAAKADVKEPTRAERAEDTFAELDELALRRRDTAS